MATAVDPNLPLFFLTLDILLNKQYVGKNRSFGEFYQT